MCIYLFCSVLRGSYERSHPCLDVLVLWVGRIWSEDTEISVVEEISDNHPNGKWSRFTCMCEKTIARLRMMWNTRLILQLGQLQKKDFSFKRQIINYFTITLQLLYPIFFFVKFPEFLFFLHSIILFLRIILEYHNFPFVIYLLKVLKLKIFLFSLRNPNIHIVHLFDVYSMHTIY